MTEYSNLNSKIRSQDFHGYAAYQENLLTSSTSNVSNGDTFYSAPHSLANSNSTVLINGGQYQYSELMGQVNAVSDRENLLFSSFYTQQQHPMQNDFVQNQQQQQHQQQQQQQNLSYINSNAGNMRLNPSTTNGYGFNVSTSPVAPMFETQSAWNHFNADAQLKKSSLEIIGTFFFKFLNERIY